MFNFIKNKLSALFSKTTIDAQSLQDLEKILLEADMGVSTTKRILENLKKQEALATVQETLKHILLQEAQKHTYQTTHSIILCVGINGSGKTTFAGKLAHFYAQQKKRVLLVAADTFRAAAPEQLHAWAHQAGADIFMGTPNQDPSAVIFAGCQKFKPFDVAQGRRPGVTQDERPYDILIIDTAGRLQTKANLMKELEKMRRTIARQLPEQPVTTLLTIDAMLGQNSLEQAIMFNECTPLDGIVLTKYDGTGKGGIVFAITDAIKVPIAFVSYGEKLEQLKPFDAQQFVSDLIG